MRIAGIVMLVIVASLFVFWWGWMRAPAPGPLCDHVVEVTMHDSADLDPDTRARLIEATRVQCESLAYDKLKLRGRIKYADWAKCLLDAPDVAAMGRC